MTTGTAAAAGTDAVAQAAKVVSTGIRACEAYGRPDLAVRLTKAQRTLANPSVHVVVVGEFKQGKSSLVNALVGATVCPVDDDVATAIPTYVRQGEQPSAELIFDGEPQVREPIALEDVRRWVVEDPAVQDLAVTRRPSGAEVRLPRKLLAGGLVLVDTPGVGGLGSAHAAASLAATSMADALIFVSDASQELTRSEVDFLRRARSMCPTVVCVMTKTDFYPYWRKIRDLNVGHLRNEPNVPVIPVSSTLRSRAVAANDAELNVESGFPELVKFLGQQVGGHAARQRAVTAAAEVGTACTQLTAQFEAERAALADPEENRRIVAELTAAKERASSLKSAAAKWSTTLNDGIADLTSDIDHDLRRRIRVVVQEASDAIEQSDPADTWVEMESWLQARVAHELLENFTILRDRSTLLSEEVGEHFREASGDVLDDIAVRSPIPELAAAQVEHKIELERMKVGKQAMVALKSAYGGSMMFMMLGTMTGITLGPIAAGIGLVMGVQGLRQEKKRQRLTRQTQGKNAVRRYCDEVSFVTGKESKDTLRSIQRQLRDYYSGLAEEFNRCNAEALQKASDGARRTESERNQRVKDIDAELARLKQLRENALAVAR
jgi:GTPase SAR1 family protein